MYQKLLENRSRGLRGNSGEFLKVLDESFELRPSYPTMFDPLVLLIYVPSLVQIGSVLKKEMMERTNIQYIRETSRKF